MIVKYLSSVDIWDYYTEKNEVIPVLWYFPLSRVATSQDSEQMSLLNYPDIWMLNEFIFLF